MSAAITTDFPSQEALDTAYDVEGSVPDFMAYANRYIAHSAAARRDLTIRESVQFGPTLPEHADIFPARRPDAPVLVFIHGGFWRMLTSREFSFVAQGFVPHDMTVVVATYDLCPRVSITEISRQMRALIAWCARNIGRYNGDPEAISVCGHSAGGHLSAMCALTDWSQYRLPENTIKSIIPISGLFDLEPISRTFMQPDLRISERDIAEASPLRLIRRVPAKMLISYGSDEPSEFANHSESFLAAWRSAGNTADKFALPGRNHFNAISDLGDPKSAQVAAIIDVMGATRRSLGSSRVDRRLFPQRAYS
ncbi:MAG: alpha/beta hydrolase [Pseudomonadota bacterium]